MNDISKHSHTGLDDTDIDLSDIPETTPEMWETARLRMPKTASIATPVSDEIFSDEIYIALGRVLSSFGWLEHELMCAVIGMRGGPDAAEVGSDEERAIKKEIEGSLGKRIRVFVDTYRTEIGEDNWIGDFEAKLEGALSCRDHFFHGHWQKRDDGWLHCTFFKRDRAAGEPQEIVWRGQHGALLEIAEANFCNARLLSSNFSPASDQAAE